MENLSRDGNTRPPYLPPEKSVCRSRRNRTGHGTTDWFQIGKGACQGSILPACLFNYHAEYIRQNARLDDILSQQLFLVTFHAKMGTIKGRNGTDVTKAEDIKKR